MSVTFTQADNLCSTAYMLVYLIGLKFISIRIDIELR